MVLTMRVSTQPIGDRDGLPSRLPDHDRPLGPAYTWRVGKCDPPRQEVEGTVSLEDARATVGERIEGYLDLDAPDHILNDPDFYWREEHILVIGWVP